ncbi:MAG: hypothetical protein ABIT09_01890 [Croceibacterium sp.]
MKREHALIAAMLSLVPYPALAQVAAGRGENWPAAFRDTIEEAERNKLLGKNGSSQEARLAIQAYGKCAARLEAKESRRLLTMDINTTKYRSGLQALSRDAERNCAADAIGPARMQSSSLLFAGAVAEALLEAYPSPLDARLARNAARDMKPFAPTDAVAQCLARSLPGQVGALFATEPGSAGETAATQPLLRVVPVCARAAGIASRIEMSVPAVRATVATAAYRLVTELEAPHA